MVWIVLGVVVFYGIMLGALGIFVKNTSLILNVPIPVIISGGIGGLSAVLLWHRSTMAKKWPFDFRWLWIVIRPLLGIIMGSFIYWAIISGILALGIPNGDNIRRPELFLVFSFVAGISDKLWEILIDRVLAPFGKQSGANSVKAL
jgi:hypothetical protein